MPEQKASYQSKAAALDLYAEAGFALFPLVGKVPLKGTAWRESEFNPVPDFKGNYGVCLRPEDLVIDVDPRNGGDESMRMLFHVCKIEPEKTLTVRTGSGGLHVYLKKPTDIRVRKKLKEYPGIDFLSVGAYVVGAGSIHPVSKKEYVIESHNGEIASASIDILNLLKRSAMEMEKGTDEYADDEQTRSRYIEYLAALEPAVEGQGGDVATFRAAAVGRDYGLALEATFELLRDGYNPRCLPPWSEDALREKVFNAYKYAENTIGNKSPAVIFPKEEKSQIDEAQDKLFHRHALGLIKTNQHNTALFFAPNFPLQGLLAFDQFSLQLVYCRPAPWHQGDETVSAWSDSENVRCRHWLSTQYHFDVNKMNMDDGALAAAYQYRFHPVRNYFEALKWDQHKRVHNWMSMYLGTVDDDYTRAVGMKTMVACVKRIYEPGCKFDYIPVLEGDQGTGKSTAWKILAGKDWFGDTPIDITKEWSILKSFGKLMYEWAEMETYRKANVQALRAFLSSDTDTVRLPYARNAAPVPRQGIFVGTFNPEKDVDIGWLHDTTGNRRYWVVTTGVTHGIDLDKLRMVRDQLWAEAVVLYRGGVPIYFEDAKVIQQAQVEQAARLGKDAWQNAVEAWLYSTHNLDRDVFTGDEIYRDCIGGSLTTYTRNEMIRVSRIMGELQWKKGIFYSRVHKKAVNGYCRPAVD